MVKSTCGIEAVYMCFNGTGIWGGETTWLQISGLTTQNKPEVSTYKGVITQFFLMIL